MATETLQKGSDSPALAGIVPYRLSAPQFRKMADILPANSRVQFEGGLLVDNRPGKTSPILHGLPINPRTIAQYLRMMDVGIFTEQSRVELLGGVLARRISKNPPRNYVIRSSDLYCSDSFSQIGS